MKDAVLIVGGTSGIGLETAKYLLDKGYNVCVSGISSADDEHLHYINVDVRLDDSVRDLYREFHKQYSKINSLVFSAGITTPRRTIAEFDEDNWNNIINTNVTGLLRLLKYFYPSLKATKGKVAVVSSMAARTFSKYSGYEYTASKSALSGIVKQLAIEWSSDGILINSVFPGMTMTPMLRKNVKESELSQIAKSVPLEKLAEPLDTAKAIEFLISDDNTYITGSGIDVSGGQVLSG